MRRVEFMILTLLVLLSLQRAAFSQDWWDIEYDGSVRPDAATPNWTLHGAGSDAILPGGIYRLTDNSSSIFTWQKLGPGLLDRSFTYEIRLKMISASEPMHAVYARVGDVGLDLVINTDRVHLLNNFVNWSVGFTTTDDFHYYRVIENRDSIYLYIDGVRMIFAANGLAIGDYFWWGSINDHGLSEAYWDYIRINSSARVFPNTPPAAACQDISVDADASCLAAVAPSAVNNGSWDPEDDTNLSLMLMPPGPFSMGITPVILIVTDSQEAADTCAAQITVVDYTAPAVTCPSDTVVGNTPGQCGRVIDFTASATDNCPGVVLAYNPPSGSLFPVGTTVVTAIATDASGNKDTCWFQVSVTDNENPSLVCPASPYNVTLPPGQISGPVDYSVTVSDNCPGVVSELAPLSGSIFSVGTTRVRCVAEDVSGNQDSCFFDVVVTASCWCPLQGDINSDTVIDVFDVIGEIGIAFSGDPDPQDQWCLKTRGDVDNNGVTDVFDVIYLIATAFSGGPNPVDPCL